jgi:hypothetical protein
MELVAQPWHDMELDVQPWSGPRALTADLDVLDVLAADLDDGDRIMRGELEEGGWDAGEGGDETSPGAMAAAWAAEPTITASTVQPAPMAPLGDQLKASRAVRRLKAVLAKHEQKRSAAPPRTSSTPVTLASVIVRAVQPCKKAQAALEALREIRKGLRQDLDDSKHYPKPRRLTRLPRPAAAADSPAGAGAAAGPEGGSPTCVGAFGGTPEPAAQPFCLRARPGGNGNPRHYVALFPGQSGAAIGDGCTVAAVMVGSAAQAAGMAPGDVVLRVGGACVPQGEPAGLLWAAAQWPGPGPCVLLCERPVGLEAAATAGLLMPVGLEAAATAEAVATEVLDRVRRRAVQKMLPKKRQRAGAGSSGAGSPPAPPPPGAFLAQVQGGQVLDLLLQAQWLPSQRFGGSIRPPVAANSRRPLRPFQAHPRLEAERESEKEAERERKRERERERPERGLRPERDS